MKNERNTDNAFMIWFTARDAAQIAIAGDPDADFEQAIFDAAEEELTKINATPDEAEYIYEFINTRIGMAIRAIIG